MKKTYSLVLILIVVIFSCDDYLLLGGDDSIRSWAKVESIDDVRRIDRETVVLDCTISLPTPCCKYSESKIQNSDSAMIIQIKSTCSDKPCIQMIATKTSSIALNIFKNQTVRLQFKAFEEIHMDTTIYFE